MKFHYHYNKIPIWASQILIDLTKLEFLFGQNRLQPDLESV